MGQRKGKTISDNGGGVFLKNIGRKIGKGLRPYKSVRNSKTKISAQSTQIGGRKGKRFIPRSNGEDPYTVDLKEFGGAYWPVISQCV